MPYYDNRSSRYNREHHDRRYGNTNDNYSGRSYPEHSRFEDPLRPAFNEHTDEDRYARIYQSHKDREQQKHKYRQDPNRDRYMDNEGGTVRNIYGGDTSNYGNLNQGGFDRHWNRIPELISSWFGGNKQKGKGPKGYHPSEERIREQVCERLTENAALDASGIDVKIEGPEVILTGTVESRADKRLAEDIAESVSGVRDVHNRLKIEDKNG